MVVKKKGFSGFFSSFQQLEDDFPLKVDFGVYEKINQYWKKQEVHSKLKESVEFKTKIFEILDGPIYANGPVHLGHLLNHILKDIVVRVKTNTGYYSIFRMGWDTHGLPIEHKVLQLLSKEASFIDIRETCKNFALEQVSLQKRTLQKIGVLTDFNDNYLTLNKEYEYWQLKLFEELVKKKLIYQDFLPLHWSCSHQTVLAENEIEYFERETISIIFRLPLGCECSFSSKNDLVGVNLLVWTTQPWTISENRLVGLCAGSFLFLVCLEETMEVVLISEKTFPFLENLMKERNSVLRIIRTIAVETVEGIHYKKIFGSGCGQVAVVKSDYVKAEEGTGIVHLAPVFGPEDYKIFRELNWKEKDGDLVCPLNPDGFFNEFSSFRGFVGKSYKEVNDYILKDLEERGLLLTKKKHKHSYPHDWRDKQPLIFRLTKQLFIDVNKIKPQILESIRKVKWIPSWTEEKMVATITERENWCFSRQRSWGVPIPVLYDKDENLIMNEDVVGFVAELVKKDGSDGWYNGEFLNLIRQNFPDLSEDVKLGTDTMDVWFDSGSAFFSNFNIFGVKKDHFIPYSLFLEGDDQFRGWFGSSLILSVALFGYAPYKEVLSHGFVVDSKGKKMSKSLGNVIDPENFLAEFGPDVVRLWVAEADFTKEIRVSDKKLGNVQNNYQKLRNTLRFLLKGYRKMKERLAKTFEENSKLSDFVVENEQQLIVLNRYVLIEISILAQYCRENYERYRFSEVCSAVLYFCTNVLSSFYFEITKKFLYFLPSFSAYSKMVFVWEEVLKTLISLIYPITPFLAEETFQYLFSFPVFSSRNSLVFEWNDSLNSYSFFDKYSLSGIDGGVAEIKTVLGFRNEMELDIWIKGFFDEFFFPILRKEVFLVIEKARESKVITCHRQAVVSLFINSSTFFLFEQKKLFDRVVLSWVREWLMIADFGINKMDRDLSYEELTDYVVSKNRNLVGKKRSSFVWSSSVLNNFFVVIHSDSLYQKCEKCKGYYNEKKMKKIDNSISRCFFCSEFY